MFTYLPDSPQVYMTWSWLEYAPFYKELAERQLTPDTVQSWLADWSAISARAYDAYQRLYVAITIDTTDQSSKAWYDRYLDEIYPAVQAAEQALKNKLLASCLEPQGFEIPLRNLRAEAAIFRQENLPLLSEELKLNSQYDAIIGAQTVEWQGQELTLAQLQIHYMNPDRALRERAWRLALERQLADRVAINDLWRQYMQLRGALATNADLPNYLVYRWQQMLRLDYTPHDCRLFHRAIEQIAVPAARRLYEKRRQRLGVETLRPWDLEVDTSGFPALHPFTQPDDLEQKTERIFEKIDPQLRDYYHSMRAESLLDLENRKGKAPGGYCTEFIVNHRPFIFMNAVGIHDDVLTLVHEGGHAFHVFESARLPYIQQLQVGMEFGEVASTSMEYLAGPYLSDDEQGFYSARDAARARLDHLERAIAFWPYMAVVDAFQQWVFDNPTKSSDPANCDSQWAELWDRFMIGVDWSGLEQEKVTGWQRKLHIHTVPMYYVEYGLAQLGAVQVWRNALRDQAGAVAAYRRALSLGGTATLPQMFAEAGAKFAFDEEILGQAVDLMVKTIAELELIN
jgi:oligoendopeptidase F